MVSIVKKINLDNDFHHLHVNAYISHDATSQHFILYEFTLITLLWHHNRRKTVPANILKCKKDTKVKKQASFHHPPTWSCMSAPAVVLKLTTGARPTVQDKINLYQSQRKFLRQLSSSYSTRLPVSSHANGSVRLYLKHSVSQNAIISRVIDSKNDNANAQMFSR